MLIVWGLDWCGDGVTDLLGPQQGSKCLRMCLADWCSSAHASQSISSLGWKGTEKAGIGIEKVGRDIVIDKLPMVYCRLNPYDLRTVCSCSRG